MAITAQGVGVEPAGGGGGRSRDSLSGWNEPRGASEQTDTHKVRSLGMWLKLETGMLLMLLLFSVLTDGEEAESHSRRTSWSPNIRILTALPESAALGTPPPQHS